MGRGEEQLRSAEAIFDGSPTSLCSEECLFILLFFCCFFFWSFFLSVPFYSTVRSRRYIKATWWLCAVGGKLAFDTHASYSGQARPHPFSSVCAIEACQANMGLPCGACSAVFLFAFCNAW